MMDNTFTIKSKCQVCGKEVMINEWGNGYCDNCGWEQCVSGLDHPDKVEYPNMISFNKAKRLYSEGMPLLPSIYDFVEATDMYGEMELTYKGVIYGVIASPDDSLCFYVYTRREFEGKYQEYSSYEEFIEKAHIGDKLLKDIWQDVENAYYMNSPLD